MNRKIVRLHGNGGVLLVNKERVTYELIELARLKIARRLKIHSDKVDAECNLTGEGKLQVRFTANAEATKDIAPEVVQRAVTEEYQAVWLNIKERFEGLGERRALQEKS